jgi:hypothetical protein
MAVPREETVAACRSLDSAERGRKSSRGSSPRPRVQKQSSRGVGEGAKPFAASPDALDLGFDLPRARERPALAGVWGGFDERQRAAGRARSDVRAIPTLGSGLSIARSRARKAGRRILAAARSRLGVGRDASARRLSRGGWQARSAAEKPDRRVALKRGGAASGGAALRVLPAPFCRRRRVGR